MLSDGRPEFIQRFLARSGFDARLALDDSQDWAGADVVWVLDNINWFPRLRRALTNMPADRRPYTLVWHTEPLPLPREAGGARHQLTLRELGKMVLRDRRTTDVYSNSRVLQGLARKGIPDLLVVSTRSRQRYLAEKGIAAEFVPLGYYESLGRDMGLARDIDVLFLGTMTDPRHKGCLRYLSDCGVRVEAAGEWGDRRYWGEERTTLINRSKIFLNLQRHPGKLSGQRMILGMANKSMVISEPIFDPEPYGEGRHYASAMLVDMPDAIRRFLANEAERTRIAEQGHQFVTTQLTAERSITEILRLADLI